MSSKPKRATRPYAPEWARDAVWYQIFPERFRNGSAANDPRPEDIFSCHVAGWHVMPWGHDWYARAEWELELGPWHRSVYLRRFGGDLLGVREKLDYLQELGVTAIYLNPIFWAPSLHKYDAICLHHVDPTLGPDRDGDLDLLARAGESHEPATWIWTSADLYFLDMVREIHTRGMRVILDGVFNHAGVQFFAFQDLQRRGRASAYVDWFRIERWLPDGRFEYHGWFGHQALPEFNRTRDDLVAPVREYIFAITRRWMDPNGDGDPSDGIDGWRLDVAFCVPTGFWKKWRKLVKDINPQAYLTGEIVGPAHDYLKGDQFDGVMHYAWLYPTLRFFCPSRHPISGRQFRRQMEDLQRSYSKTARFLVQNLLDSHDLGRIATVLENRLELEDGWESLFRLSSVSGNPDLKTWRPGRATYQVLRQLVMFQMVYVGAPMIYYGTEVGMWGANDPDNRQPMLWEDVRYEPEKEGPNGRRLRRARVRGPDMAFCDFYKRAIALRRQYTALRRGALEWVDTSDERLIAFWRKGSPNVLALFNASDHDCSFETQADLRDIWTGRRVTAGHVKVPPRGWLVLSDE